MAEQDYQNGLKVRTEVMGAAFVERAQNNTTELTQPLQDWINEHAWGSTWQREGVLERKTRSLITLAIRYSPMSRPNNHKIKIELG